MTDGFSHMPSIILKEDPVKIEDLVWIDVVSQDSYCSKNMSRVIMIAGLILLNIDTEGIE